jgi:hypothetical protein
MLFGGCILVGCAVAAAHGTHTGVVQMTQNTQTYPVYAVNADRETGEWIGDARPTGERATRAQWQALESGDDTHRDTYEGAGDDARLIVITWVDDNSDMAAQ